MMSDVPFGVFLSGGVDSSTNVALMSELMDEPVRTFSVGFERYERYNELEYARTIARKFGTDHHEVVIDSGDLESFLPELIYHQDEPIADWVAVPLHYVSKLARDNGTVVVQIGEGSDELFHGYQGYLSHARFDSRYRPPFQRVPRPLRRALSARHGALSRAGSGKFVGHAQAIEQAAEGRNSFWGGAIAYQGELKERVLSNGRAAPRLVRDRPAVLARGRGAAARRRPPAEDDLPRAEEPPRRAAADAGRQDDDGELGRGARAVPRPRAGRVRAGAPAGDEGARRRGQVPAEEGRLGLLPQEIVDRPKQGFSAPVSEWFRDELGERARREIRTSSLAERGLLDYDAIDDLWRAHRAGRGDWAFQLWNIYNVSAWHDYWIAGRVPAG